MRASEAVAAAQVQQARDIAARFSEQSAKNQHDSRRDYHFEQRLMLQVRLLSSSCPPVLQQVGQRLMLQVRLSPSSPAAPASPQAGHSGHQQRLH